MVLEDEIFYQGSLIGFIGSINNILFIAFRGTNSHNEWSKDLEFSQVMLKDVVDQEPFMDINCHSGFVSIYRTFRDQIIGKINSSLIGILLYSPGIV